MSKRKHDETAPAKKQANQTYLPEYHDRWKPLGPSKMGQHYVHCSLCNADFSCKHGGAYDCKRHVQSSTHERNKKCSESSSIERFCGVNFHSIELERHRSITKAELKMCGLIAKHNLSLSTADSLVKSFKEMFPDSRIATGMKCGRNKSTCLIKELAVFKQDELSNRMKSMPFTISTDGSNDDKSKQYPVVVRTIDTSFTPVNSEPNADNSEQPHGPVSSELLSIPICNGSATGEAIFQLLNEELQKRNIPWSHCLALGCDNASVMTGRHKGLIAFVRQHQPEVFLAGCTLHLVHIAAKKAATAALPPIDQVLVDIFYYFNKSDKRQTTFRGLQQLYNIDQKRMLKHVCTRWLSIGRCVSRLLHNWDALKVYFAEEEKTSNSAAQSTYAEKKVDAIYSFVRSPTNRLYVLFLEYTIHVFDDVLLKLQAEAPQIYLLRRCLLKVLRNVLTRFVKPCALTGKMATDVEYKLPYNIKCNEALVIGESAEKYIADKEQHHLRDIKIQEFYKNVVKYFTEVCDYMVQKLPFDDPVLSAAEVVDVRLQTESKRSDLEYFLKKYPCLLPPKANINKITEQFVLYQSADISKCLKTRMDETWWAISEMKDEDGSLLFKELSLVMVGILTIPHSSAHCERVFSCVRKNRTDQRSSLGDDTLEALLVVKSSPENSTSTYSNQQLDHIKGAYARALKSKQPVENV